MNKLNNINSKQDHILACLSSAPSNAKIIRSAARMAKALGARFTAIYVQTDTVINDEDQSRLSQNIQLAQRLGAEIVMTHGEDYLSRMLIAFFKT